MVPLFLGGIPKTGSRHKIHGTVISNTSVLNGAVKELFPLNCIRKSSVATISAGRRDSLQKPPRFIGMRIEKVLPLPGDHGALI